MPDNLDRNALVAIRPGTADDVNLIYASWLRGLYYGDSWFSMIPKDVFMKHYHAVIDNILTRPDTFVKVACLKDDPEVVLGYVVLKGANTVHWVFVKDRWRHIGIAKSLIPPQVSAVTHLNKVGKELLSTRSNIVFNPFL